MIDSGVKGGERPSCAPSAPVADEAHIEPAMNWNDPDEGVLAQIDRRRCWRPTISATKGRLPLPVPHSLVIHSDLRVSVCRCVDWAQTGRRRRPVETDAGGSLAHRAPARFSDRASRRTASELTACRNCTFLHRRLDNLDGLTVAEFAQRFADAEISRRFRKLMRLSRSRAEVARVIQEQADIFSDHAEREELDRTEKEPADQHRATPTGRLFQNSSLMTR